MIALNINPALEVSLMMARAMEDAAVTAIKAHFNWELNYQDTNTTIYTLMHDGKPLIDIVQEIKEDKVCVYNRVWETL
jgi:hypothetical protein